MAENQSDSSCGGRGESAGGRLDLIRIVGMFIWIIIFVSHLHFVSSREPHTISMKTKDTVKWNGDLKIDHDNTKQVNDPRIVPHFPTHQVPSSALLYHPLS